MTNVTIEQLQHATVRILTGKGNAQTRIYDAALIAMTNNYDNLNDAEQICKDFGLYQELAENIKAGDVPEYMMKEID